MRRVSSVILAAVFILSIIFVLPASQNADAAGSYPFIFNDEILYLVDTQPIIYKGEFTCVPSEKLLEKIQAKAVYEAETNTYHVTRGRITLSFNLTSGYSSSDQMSYFYAPGFYQNNSYYLPLEYVADNFDLLFTKISDGLFHLQSQPSKITDEQWIRIFKTKTSDTAADKKTPTFYLSFDDEPSSYTGEILENLRKSGVTATFFMTEQNMKAYPAMVRRVLNEGHTIGLSPSKNIGAGAATSAVTNSINSANDTFQKITKQRVFLVMPLSGQREAFTQNVRNLLTASGYRIYDANITLPDSNTGEAAATTKSEFGAIVKYIKWNSNIKITSKRNSAELIADVVARKDYSLVEMTEFTEPVNYFSDFR